MANSCNIYNIHNCSGGCFLCNTTDKIVNDYLLSSLCKTNDFCIEKGESCDERIFLESCIITNNLVKAFIALINIIAFTKSFKRITNSFTVYKYNKVKQGVFFIFYSTINLAVPGFLIFTTNLIYVVYSIVCILSYLYVFTCIPKLKKTDYLINTHYTEYQSLSNTLPITPSQSRAESPIPISIPTPDEVNLGNNNPLPTIQSHT